MGVTLAGWYSYNLATPSAEYILAEYQNLQIGDLVPMSPDGKQGIWVRDFDKPNWMLWWDKKGDNSWVWVIYPDAENQSRLITCVSVKYRWFSLAIAFNMLFEFFNILMMRKCMLGIKRRAEEMQIS